MKTTVAAVVGAVISTSALAEIPQQHMAKFQDAARTCGWATGWAEQCKVITPHAARLAEANFLGFTRQTGATQIQTDMIGIYWGSGRIGGIGERCSTITGQGTRIAKLRRDLVQMVEQCHYRSPPAAPK